MLLPKPKLMVIEDDVAIIDLLRLNFELQGFEVAACDRSLSALPDCLVELPDVIVLDLLMPGQSGWQVLESLRDNPVTRDLPVVICSVLGSDLDRAHAEAMGVMEYLVKPFELWELKEAVIRASGWKGRSPGTPPALTASA